MILIREDRGIMPANLKRLLIVDDSEINRELLKNILINNFDIIEADNGYSALEIIFKERNFLDAILLDISMPVLNGFNVLQIMKDNGIEDIPVFMITAEATKPNVEKAAQFNISDFIGKPFDNEDILKRFKKKFNIPLNSNRRKVPVNFLTEKDISETNAYISKLEKIFKNYLKNLGENDGHYVRIADLMKILLKVYSENDAGAGLLDSHINIISKAAYFCDIGNMTVSSETVKSENRSTSEEFAYHKHTVYGADIIRLNPSKSCWYFVNVCADICLHHHERFDGKGFPYKLYGNNISIYAQMCNIINEFDNLFFKGDIKCDKDDLQFDFFMHNYLHDEKIVSNKIFSLFNECRKDIISYYNAN